MPTTSHCSEIIKMKVLTSRLLFVVLLIGSASSADETAKNFEFPEDFRFGAASAAYQIEGAWNIDGKTASIWDTFAHNRPDMIADRSNGDISADSYHFYEKDIAALKEIGVRSTKIFEEGNKVL